MRDLTVEELEFLVVALDGYRENVSPLERTTLHNIEELKDLMREEWTSIKGWNN
jgi:hypothetical protein